MLTAVIRADHDAGSLAATLSMLIPGVIAGSLGDAVVVSSVASDDVRRIAETTGAAHRVHAQGASAWATGAEAARGRWLLLLSAGEIPQGEWLRTLEAHLMTAPDRAALLPLGGAGGIRERLAVLAGPRRLRSGLLLPTRMAAAGWLDASPVRLGGSRRGRP